jgi:hypothetical protein
MAVERELNGSDNVYEILESLKLKQLPGMSQSNSPGQLKSSNNHANNDSNDDNIIKIIINKKKSTIQSHLIRVFIYDESDETGDLRMYKTISITSETTVSEMIGISMKKFKLSPQPDQYELKSIINDKQVTRSSMEHISAILNEVDKDDIPNVEFVLSKVASLDKKSSVSTPVSSKAGMDSAVDLVSPAIISERRSFESVNETVSEKGGEVEINIPVSAIRNDASNEEQDGNLSITEVDENSPVLAQKRSVKGPSEIDTTRCSYSSTGTLASASSSSSSSHLSNSSSTSTRRSKYDKKLSAKISHHFELMELYLDEAIKGCSEEKLKVIEASIRTTPSP